jgi:hypothetical protein
MGSIDNYYLYHTCMLRTMIEGKAGFLTGPYKESMPLRRTQKGAGGRMH